MSSVILLNFWYLFFKFISESCHYIEYFCFLSPIKNIKFRMQKSLYRSKGRLKSTGDFVSNRMEGKD